MGQKWFYNCECVKHSLFLYYYFIIFHMNNCKPTLAPPCVILSNLRVKELCQHRADATFGISDHMNYSYSLYSFSSKKIGKIHIKSMTWFMIFIYRHITLFTEHFLVWPRDSIPVKLIASCTHLEQHGARDTWEPRR